MHRLRSTVAAALCAAAPFTSSAQGLEQGAVEIALRPDVVVQHRQVRLGDVAFLRTSGLDVIQRLVDLPIGEAPRAGEAVLDRAALARWIRSRAGIAAERLVWHGAERSRVRATAQVLPAARIERTALLALQEWLGRRSSRFDIDSAGLQHDIEMPAGRLELKARPLPQGARPASRMVVWVDAWVDGQFVRAVPVGFAVAAYGDAWVARAPLPAGALLQPDMLERREVDLAAAPAPLAAAGREAVAASALRTAHPVRAGEALGERNVRAVSAVARGEWVTLRLNAQAMQMEARAEALQEGELGQTVKVRLGGAADSVRALVVGRGQVEAMP